MTADFIDRVARPNTVASLTAELRSLGVKPGMALLVHASLSSLGFVAGGAVAAVQALVDALGAEGTLVMPAHSSDLSEPSNWRNPPVPEAWWPVIRSQTPAFDPRVTPTRRMGAIAEVFRTWPGVLRSYHPATSFAALGPHAEFITRDHKLDDSLGDGSPLARLYDLDGSVLLLGVRHDRNTSFHLAEYRAKIRGRMEEGAPVLQSGVRVWRKMKDIQLDDDDFTEIGEAVEARGHCAIGLVGAATARLFRQRPAVDIAVEWLRRRYGNR